VDDVVDGGFIVFPHQHGRGGGVVEVDEGHHAAPVADEREHPFAHGLDQPVVGRRVEAAVAKRNGAAPPRSATRSGALWSALERLFAAWLKQRFGNGGSHTRPGPQ
jgi:hypothetical protein